jgi:anti-sigma B factor antagonist
MQVTQLETTLRTHGDIVVIDLNGEINSFAEQALTAAYNAAESRNPPAILLNFSGTDYINSTGIALIVSLLTRARKSQRRLAACGLSNHYAEIFQITRLADFINIFNDETSALAGIVK